MDADTRCTEAETAIETNKAPITERPRMDEIKRSRARNKGARLTFREDFGLESLAERQFLQIADGLKKRGILRFQALRMRKGLNSSRTYGEQEDEESGAEETADDGHELAGDQVGLEHLHGGHEHERRGGRDDQRVDCGQS